MPGEASLHVVVLAVTVQQGRLYLADQHTEEKFKVQCISLCFANDQIYLRQGKYQEMKAAKNGRYVRERQKLKEKHLLLGKVKELLIIRKRNKF